MRTWNLATYFDLKYDNSHVISFSPGDLHVRAGEHEESARVYEQLYHRNPENTEYIEKYITARQPCTIILL